MSGQSPLQQNRSLGGVIKSAATGFFNRTFSRLRGAGIGSNSRIVNTRAKWGGRSDKKDWRVRLTIPDGSPLEQAIFTQPNNELLAPLLNTKGMFWPLTPSMVIQHSANYDALTMTHSNYPAQAYQSSQVDQLNIIGEFPVQNSDDAKHWIATVQFLRTVTKMFFGRSQQLKGSPPPILHLNGYGDHMFTNVPVVVNSFNVELRSGIDYISTKQNNTEYKQFNGPDAGFDLNNPYEAQTWAPTISLISVLITPIYSRNSVSRFSLADFARGKLQGNQNPDQIGFI